MIRFRCRCDEPFEIPDELAGTSFQCPRCGLLVDVPTLDDLPGLGERGTYKLHEVPLDLADEGGPPRKVVGAGADTPHVAARYDQADRRMSLNEFLNIGMSEEDLLQVKGETAPGVAAHPKYDPVTGELVTPIEVKEPPRPIAKAIPVAAGPAPLAYERKAVGNDAPRNLWWPVVEMFRLPNMLVVLIVTAMHYLSIVGFASLGRFLFPLILVLPVIMITIAHFANIIDETGPSAVDEIPRPMRGGNGYDDFLKPLVQVFTAYFFAWLPVLLFNRYAFRLPWLADLAFLTLFFILVPAFLITIITSGAFNNMLPNRALSVIAAAGKDYWIAVITGVAATFTFILGTLLALFSGYNLIRLVTWMGPPASFKAKPMFPVPMFIEALATPVVIFGSVYLVHVFCWQMGLIYRKHHERFNWVLQKHDKTARTDTLAQLHQHRQKQLEAKAAKARAKMEQRNAQRAPLPIAKPAEQRFS